MAKRPANDSPPRVDSPARSSPPSAAVWAQFVTVPENRAAWLAVRRLGRVLRDDCRRRLPMLYLHGSPGTGKSYLVSLLVEAVARDAPARTARLLAAADFAPASGPPDAEADGQDRDAWRGCDLLVVEDLQHLPARSADALAALIDYRQARQRPLVCTAAVGPAQLPDLPSRLINRLAGGLVVQLEPPALPSRLVLLRQLADRRGLAVEADALAWVGARTTGGVRPLLGALNRLEALARPFPPPLTLARVRDLWGDDGNEPGAVGPIAARVGRHFRVDLRRLRGPDRRPNVLWPRQVGMYLARQLTGLSLAQIGAYFGGRDHSTVLHACRKVEDALAHDPDLAGQVRQLRAELA